MAFRNPSLMKKQTVLRKLAELKAPLLQYGVRNLPELHGRVRHARELFQATEAGYRDFQGIESFCGTTDSEGGGVRVSRMLQKIYQ